MYKNNISMNNTMNMKNITNILGIENSKKLMKNKIKI